DDVEEISIGRELARGSGAKFVNGIVAQDARARQHEVGRRTVRVTLLAVALRAALLVDLGAISGITGGPESRSRSGEPAGKKCHRPTEPRHHSPLPRGL